MSKTEDTIRLNVVANNPNSTHYQMMELLYKGFVDATVSLVECRNNVTGEIDNLLCGFEHDEESGGMNFYPLAVIIAGVPEGTYSVADGQGGYLGDEEDEDVGESDESEDNSAS